MFSWQRPKRPGRMAVAAALLMPSLIAQAADPPLLLESVWVEVPHAKADGDLWDQVVPASIRLPKGVLPDVRVCLISARGERRCAPVCNDAYVCQGSFDLPLASQPVRIEVHDVDVGKRPDVIAVIAEKDPARCAGKVCSYPLAGGRVLRLRFNGIDVKPCVVAPLPLDKTYQHEAPGLYGPYPSPEAAAIAIEPILRAATDREDKEYAAYVLSPAAGGEPSAAAGGFYLSTPVGSTALRSFTVADPDWDRSADLAVKARGCPLTTDDFNVWATIHTHPRYIQNKYAESAGLGRQWNSENFSNDDFSSALDFAEKTPVPVPYFLLAPDLCVKRFRPRPGQPRCDAPSPENCHAWVEVVACRRPVAN